MEFKLLRAAVRQERQQWLAAYAQLPAERQDVYFLPEYLQPLEGFMGVEAYCAAFSGNDAILLYPFLKYAIRQQEDSPYVEMFYDIESAYGYGGPVVNVAGEAPTFLHEAWSHFAEWCSTERVVSEFVRFYPLLDNVRWAPKTMKTFKDRITVPIMLGSYPTDLLNSSYYRVHRQMISKAERVGFSFHILPLQSELSWFVPLYLETQEFLQAGSDTRFGSDYFASLAQGFGARAWLGVVKHSGEITAAVLVLEGQTCLHSHLMGYRRNIKTAGMTNLAYHGIALEGAKRGKAILHMGGGRSSSAEDSLFRFKESLSPERAHFWLGTLCHNKPMYDDLGRQWEIEHGPRPKNYLQFYHLQGSSHTVS